MADARTLPSRQRTNLLQAYRSRGRKNRNIWLAYSQKTNRDWILRSDRHLVHWVVFLEVDPTIAYFDLDPKSMQNLNSGLRSDFLEGTKFTVDAEVRLIDGRREYHRIGVEPTQKDKTIMPSTESFIYDGCTVRVIPTANLVTRGQEALRWMKLLGYCAVIRDQEHTHASTRAATVLRSLNEGTLELFIREMADFDPGIALGIFSRFAVLGDVHIDLADSGLNLQSKWTWRTGR
jgi:hypothetical protein